MQITFTPSEDYGPHGRERVDGKSLAAVSKADLRWYYFLGTVEISHSGVEVGPPWGWVPLFDVMYNMQQVMIFARGGDARGRIDFTENDEVIEFSLEGDLLRVTPTYFDAELVVTVDDFILAGSNFIRSELSRITSEYRTLAENTHVRKLAQEVSLDLSRI
ncbi:hypothetical protein ACIPSA_29320 [Streptomyces sp. NPDC086549]|uniref:hypothetical protein n=1 Tax=Streptomyces sp. NPDC086549 TaxID=3365752 RepID=UPI003814E3A3